MAPTRPLLTSQVVFLDSARDTPVKRVGRQTTNPNDRAAAGQLRCWEYGGTDLGPTGRRRLHRRAAARPMTIHEGEA